MEKETVIESLSEAHKEVGEQSAIISGYLKVFNKENVISDLDKIVEFFNGSMIRHFMKEEIIFNALLKVGNIKDETAEVIKESIDEHEALTEEFRELSDYAGKIKDGDTELAYDFIKKCQSVMLNLRKHAQVEDLVIYKEVNKKLNDRIFKTIKNDLLNI